MQILLTLGAYDERAEPLYARGLSGGNGEGRNCLNLRGSQPLAASAQTRSSMGGTLRGYDASLATGRQKGGWQRIMFMCNTHEHVALPTRMAKISKRIAPP